VPLFDYLFRISGSRGRGYHPVISRLFHHHALNQTPRVVGLYEALSLALSHCDKYCSVYGLSHSLTLLATFDSLNPLSQYLPLLIQVGLRSAVLVLSLFLRCNFMLSSQR
jgi:hypothetical protein